MIKSLFKKFETTRSEIKSDSRPSPLSVLVMGNSHVAAVKAAWDRVHADYAPDIELTFFASSASTMLDTLVNGRCLLPKTQQVRKSWEITSGGAVEIDFNQYDVVFIHGPFERLSFNSQQLRKLNKAGFFSQRFTDQALLYSRPLAAHLAAVTKACFNGPIIVSSRPNHGEQPSQESKSVDREKVSRNYRRLTQRIAGACEREGLIYMPQPLDTLKDMSTTWFKFAEKAIGLGNTPKKEGVLYAEKGDQQHMNALYGEVVIKQLCNLCKNS